MNNQKKLEICFFADGESIHTVRWCSHFHELGHEIHLISFKKVEIPHIHVHVIDSGTIHVAGGNWKVLLKFQKVKKILKQISPDIFHALYATSYGITGALCGFHPYIITALGSDVLISPKESRVLRSLLRFAFLKADWITVMAPHMKEVVLQMGISTQKVEVLPFGIDPKVFNQENKQLHASKFVITSTRNFETVYNIPHLIRAVAQAKTSIPTIELNLIGVGSLKNELEQLVNDLNLQENVHFFGKVPQTKIAEVLKQSHLFVSTSLSDGNNISLNEAMACGTLCIATNIPANTQWITDGENGFLVEIDNIDQLSKLIELSANSFIEIQNKAVPLNQLIIEEKGIWHKNMKQMEEQYHNLIKRI